MQPPPARRAALHQMQPPMQAKMLSWARSSKNGSPPSIWGWALDALRF